jgi:hypothetical protein
VLAVVEDGAEGLRVGGVQLVARPGDLVLLSPGEVHDGWAQDGRGFSYRAVYPSRDLVARAVGLPLAAPGVPCFRDNVITDPKIADGLRRAHGWLAAAGNSLDGQAALASVLELLFDRYGAHDPNQRRVLTGTAAIARQLLDARLLEPVPLADLARPATRRRCGCCGPSAPPTVCPIATSSSAVCSSPRAGCGPAPTWRPWRSTSASRIRATSPASSSRWSAYRRAPTSVRRRHRLKFRSSQARRLTVNLGPTRGDTQARLER